MSDGDIANKLSCLLKTVDFIDKSVKLFGLEQSDVSINSGAICAINFKSYLEQFIYLLRK